MRVGESGENVTRRAFLRKAAATGATLAWAAPVVKTLTPSAAFAASPKDFSYVAFCYTCDGGATRCCAKFELNDNGLPVACETDNFGTPSCPFPFDTTDQNCGNCALFSVTSPDGGQTINVTFTGAAPLTCLFVVGQGVGKCGHPPEHGECVQAQLLDGGRRIRFSMCGV
jgi:hypothetical protein